MAIPWKWKPRKLRDGGKFAGRTDRILGTQPGLEIGSGTHRVSAMPEEVKEWREAHRPGFGGISTSGGAKAAIPSPRGIRDMSLYEQGEDGGAAIKESALDNPASVNPELAGLERQDARRATERAIDRGTQRRLL